MKLSEIDRLKMMSKRQAYFSAIAEEYTSFADFIKTQDMWLAIMGIEMTDCGRYLKLHIQMDFVGYEEYYVTLGDDGHLTVSDIVMLNDDVCCTNYIDINTGKPADKESIFKLE